MKRKYLGYEMPHSECDEACMYQCTEAGARPPACSSEDVKTGKPKLSHVYPYMVPCPYLGCNAKAGQHCGRPSGHRGPFVQPHAARRKAANTFLKAQTADD